VIGNGIINQLLAILVCPNYHGYGSNRPLSSSFSHYLLCVVILPVFFLLLLLGAVYMLRYIITTTTLLFSITTRPFLAPSP
jgi:hypothetical protein